MATSVPKRSAGAILSNIPDGIRLIDDVVDFEYVFVVDFAQFFVNLLFFVDVIQIRLILLYFADRYGVVEVTIEGAEDLSFNDSTCAKFPSPISSALLSSYSFLKNWERIRIDLTL